VGNVVSNFSDFIGGSGGGANIPYKGSTAEVAYTPVVEGTYYNLDSSGKLVPSSAVLSTTEEISQTTLAQANGGSLTRNAYPFNCGQYEGQMSNGNILYAFSNYLSSSSMGIGFVVLDSTGTQLSYAGTDFDSNYYNSNYYQIESIGEDSTNYIFTAFTKGQNSSNNAGAIRGYILTVRKSDNVITFYPNSNLVYSFNNSTSLNAGNEFGGSLQLARSRSVYCAIAMSAAASSTSLTYELSSGTVSGTYAQVEQTTTSLLTVYDGLNIQLIKYDDSSANFLLAYQTVQSSSAQGYVVKKVLVAADGTHTVTDITPSALSQGTGSTQQQARFTRLYKSEDKSKFLLMSVPSRTEAKYQKTSYDGSTLTVGSLQKYNTPSGADNYLFRDSETGWQRSLYFSSAFYRYAEDKLYIAPRQTYETWSNYKKGAVWTLGSGNVYQTAVQTDLFDNFSNRLLDSSNLTTYSTSYDGIITERISVANSYVVGQTAQFWDTSPVTLDKIAYARQSGNVGQTVNISLIEGVTSSETLPSTYWLSKEDMYYEYSTAVVSAPSFSYLKPIAKNFVNLSSSTVNAVAQGEAALTVTAPEGKYLKIEAYYALANQLVGLKIDGTVFAEYSGTASVNAVNAYAVILNGNSSGGPSIAAPIICKEFIVYRSGSGTISANTYVTYTIGEPA
jgi:hypothetical protein